MATIFDSEKNSRIKISYEALMNKSTGKHSIVFPNKPCQLTDYKEQYLKILVCFLAENTLHSMNWTDRY